MVRVLRGCGRDRRSGFDTVRFAFLEELSDCGAHDGLEGREIGGQETREGVDTLEWGRDTQV